MQTFLTCRLVLFKWFGDTLWLRLTFIVEADISLINRCLFSAAMVELDGDDIRISSRGKLAERDIVQVGKAVFPPFHLSFSSILCILATQLRRCPEGLYPVAQDVI